MHLQLGNCFNTWCPSKVRNSLNGPEKPGRKKSYQHFQVFMEFSSLMRSLDKEKTCNGEEIQNQNEKPLPLALAKLSVSIAIVITLYKELSTWMWLQYVWSPLRGRIRAGECRLLLSERLSCFIWYSGQPWNTSLPFLCIWSYYFYHVLHPSMGLLRLYMCVYKAGNLRGHMKNDKQRNGKCNDINKTESSK